MEKYESTIHETLQFENDLKAEGINATNKFLTFSITLWRRLES